MALLLGIDLGTSYLKAALFDSSGRLRGLGRTAAGVHAPDAVRRELPVTVFLERLREAVTAALRQAGATGAEIDAVSYGSQANTFLLLDTDSRPLTPLIFWHDQRARPLEAGLQAYGATTERREHTGLWQMVPESLPAKLHWLKQQDPEFARRCGSVMTISDYLTYFLTGNRVGDASTAALTGLYDLAGRGWWEEALMKFGLRRSQLSSPLLPGSHAGQLTSQAAEFFGLVSGTPVAAGALDHHAAAIGSGLGVQVEASLSSGTVLAAIMLCDKIVPAESCIYGPHAGEGSFFVLAFDPAGATRLEEYQRVHAPETPLSELLSRLDAGGATDVHSENLRQHLGEMARTEGRLLASITPGRHFSRLAATGGGARSRTALQIKADVLNARIISTSPEPACLGAAALAGMGAGIFPDLPSAQRQLVQSSQEFFPAGGVLP